MAKQTDEAAARTPEEEAYQRRKAHQADEAKQRANDAKQRDQDEKERLKQTKWVFVETKHPAKQPINVGSSSMKSGDDRHIGPLGFYELNYREIEKLGAKSHLCRFVILPEGVTPKDVRVEKISEAVGALSPEKQKEIANKMKADALAAPDEKG